MYLYYKIKKLVLYLWFSPKSGILSEVVFILEYLREVFFIDHSLFSELHIHEILRISICNPREGEFFHLSGWFPSRTVATENCFQIQSRIRDIRNERTRSEEQRGTQTGLPSSAKARLLLRSFTPPSLFILGH